jgi:aminoglycoside N3'-acetyltransferase
MGVSHTCNTTLHTVEDTNGAPTRSSIIYYPRVIDMDGRVVTVPTRPHLHAMPRRYQVMDDICRSEGIQRETTIGSAHVRLIDARRLYELGSVLIKNTPIFLLDMEKLA